MGVSPGNRWELTCRGPFANCRRQIYPEKIGSGVVQEVPKSITKERSSSPTDLQAYVLSKSVSSGFAQVDPVGRLDVGSNGDIGGRSLGSLTNAESRVQKQLVAKSEISVMFKTAPAVVKASVIPRSDHYDLTQIDPVGKMDEGANVSMGDWRWGSLADTKAIAAELGVQNKSVTKSGFSGFSKKGSDLRGAGPDLGMGIMGDHGMGVIVGSKKHVQESDISGGVALGIAPTFAGHDPVG